MTENTLRKSAEILVKDKGLREMAREMEISPAYLCDVVHGRRGIGHKIAAFFGYKLTVRTIRTFERIGK